MITDKEEERNSNVSAVNHNACTGCTACVSVCPVHCIDMVWDYEGFSYPKVDIVRCVHCGKCYHMCPAINKIETHQPLEAYAAAYKIDEKVKNSSSGGAFYALAHYVIEQLHGEVCGAVMDESLRVYHVLTSDVHGIVAMQGSKYVQSDVRGCYAAIAECVAAGRVVLFCGTPCQVAGLLRFVRQGRENLYTVDLICHGVPSPQAFVEYIKRNYNIVGLSRLTFRDKNQHESSTYGLLFQYWNGSRQRVFSWQDPFYQAFLAGASYREGCYQCIYAQSSRGGDLTIGDCANEKTYAEFAAGRVLSTVLVNTEQGRKLWGGIADWMDYTAAAFEQEVALNHQLHEPVRRPELRDMFYYDLANLDKGRFAQKICPKRGARIRIKHWVIWHIPISIRKIIKRTIGRS